MEYVCLCVRVRVCACVRMRVTCWVQPLSSARVPSLHSFLLPIVGAVTWAELSNLSVTELGCSDDSCGRDTKEGRKAGRRTEKWSECLRAKTSLVSRNAASGRARKTVFNSLRGLDAVSSLWVFEVQFSHPGHSRTLWGKLMLLPECYGWNHGVCSPPGSHYFWFNNNNNDRNSNDNKKITRISTNSWGISRYQHTMYIILFNFLTNPIKEKLFYKWGNGSLQRFTDWPMSHQ